jgi:hypothetical protein
MGSGVVARTNVAAVHLIFLCKGFEALERLLLGSGRGQTQRATKTNGLWHGLVNKSLKGGQTKGRKHDLLLGCIGAEMTLVKLVLGKKTLKRVDGFV